MPDLYHRVLWHLLYSLFYDMVRACLFWPQRNSTLDTAYDRDARGQLSEQDTPLSIPKQTHLATQRVRWERKHAKGAEIFFAASLCDKTLVLT